MLTNQEDIKSIAVTEWTENHWQNAELMDWLTARGWSRSEGGHDKEQSDMQTIHTQEGD